MVYIARLYRWLLVSPSTPILLVLPIVAFFVYFFAFCYNIPWFDDFENIPYFLDRFLTAPSFGQKMSALLRPNNEHRVVYARLVTLGQYFVTGGLNFSYLMLWGNGALLVIFYLIYRALRQHEGQVKPALVGLLPVSLLLFSAQMYLMTFTAVFTLQYLSIIMLAMLTFFFLAANRPFSLPLAILLGMLSTFSMGNGMLVWPAGVGMLFIQRRWSALGLWLLIGALGIYFYFYDYPVQQGNADGFVYVLAHPLQTLAGFVILVGNAFDIFPTLPITYRVYPPFVAGLVLLAGLGYWLLKTLFIRERSTSFLDVFSFGCLLFLLATFSLFALFRIRFNFEMVVHISYRIYALTLCSLACVLLFSRLSAAARMRLWPLVWFFFLALNLFTYYTFLPRATERRLTMKGLTFNQQHSNIGLGGSRNSALADYISNLLSMMKQRGWYSLPNPAITPHEQLLLEPVSAPTSPMTLQVEQRPDYIVVSNNEPDYQVGYDTGTYIILQSEQHTYLMFAGKKSPLGYKPWAVEPGLYSAIPVQMLQPGHYQLGLFRTTPDHASRQFINQFIDVN